MGNNQSTRSVYRLPPCPAYDVEGMESWLGDLAQEGLLLSRDGFFAGFAIFNRGEPAQLRYRLTAAAKKTGMWEGNGGAPDADAVEMNEHFGWEYVASRGEFHIYRAFDSGARELNTDPQVQAIAIGQVQKRARSAVITSALMALVYPLVLIRGSLVLAMLALGSAFVLFGVVLLLWSFTASVLHAVHLTKLRKKLISEGAINHNKAWRKSANRYRVLKVAFVVCTVLCSFLLLIKWGDSKMGKGEIPLSEFDGTVPFATMIDFAADGEYAEKNYGFANTVRVWSDLLAPVIVNWEEIATVTLPDGRVLDGGLFVEYSETISPWLAHKAAREYQRMARWKGIGDKYFEELQTPQIDADYVFAYTDSTHFPSAIIQKGNVVVRAAFYQFSASSLSLSIDEWAAILAGSI